MTVAGVDGCKGGWIVATLPHEPGPGATLTFSPSIETVIRATRAGELKTVAIDMPIGLPTGAPRTSDALARAELGTRRSTFFPTPAFETLACDDFPSALAASRDSIGVGLSKQAFYLLPKVRELRKHLQPSDQPAVFEAHPELSFQELATRTLAKKTTAAGIGQRIRTLLPHVPDLVELLAETPAEAKIDDALDAFANAWTARRAALGQARTIGDPAFDSEGFELFLRV